MKLNLYKLSLMVMGRYSKMVKLKFKTVIETPFPGHIVTKIGCEEVFQINQKNLMK